MGAQADDRDEVIDSADLGIVAVLEAAQMQALRVREIYLLGLAKDPEKEQTDVGLFDKCIIFKNR